MKKLASILLAILMAALMSSAALAEGAAKIGNTEYATLADAVNAANSGDTIELLSNVTISNGIVIEKSLTIDGGANKYTITATSERAIDALKTNTTNLTLKNLKILSSQQRGVNFNNGGTLTMNNVEIDGPIYAVNFPNAADKAKVNIENCTLKGNIALNIWGEDMQINVKNSMLYAYDKTSAEAYAAIQLNNNGDTMAEGTVVDVSNSTLTAEGDSAAVVNGTLTGKVNLSNCNYSAPIRNAVVVVTYKTTDDVHICMTLAEAIEQAYLSRNAVETVKLLSDVELEETVTIPAGLTVTLDLAGHTISQEKACTGSYSMIENNGALTITGNGKLSFTDTGSGDPNVRWASYTIRNNGTLVVENGTIEHLGAQMYNGNNAIFHYSGSVTINDGNILAPYSRSLRVWNGTATINGGTFNGQVWVQPQPMSDTCSLTINGGSFKPATKGKDGSSVFVTNSAKNPGLSVMGGTFETKIGCSDPSKLAGSITGGAFTENAKNGTNNDLLAEGYTFVKMGDYYYSGKAYTVNFNVTPADATIVVNNGTGNTMKANADDSYTLLPGTYTYTISASGYSDATNSFSVTNADKTVTVVLETIVVDLPKTGDDSHVALWLAMMFMSMIALCGMVRKSRVN